MMARRVAFASWAFALLASCIIVSHGWAEESKDESSDAKSDASEVKPDGNAQKVKKDRAMSAVLDFTMTNIDGKPVKFAKYKGKVLLLVNTASQCGFTPQYAGLEALYREHKKEGFAVLAFPSNDFGAQEPGTEAEIKQYCKTKYDVTFPLFAKIVVKGDNRHPLYQFLTDKKTNPKHGGEIKWNFTKFLIGRDGSVLARFESPVKPTDEALTKALADALAVKKANSATAQ